MSGAITRAHVALTDPAYIYNWEFFNKKCKNCKRATTMLDQTYKGGYTRKPAPDFPARAEVYTVLNLSEKPSGIDCMSEN